MTPKQLIDHYGSIRAAAEAIGVSYQAVWAWHDRGRIPLNTQCMIEIRSLGRLRAGLDQPVSQRAEERAAGAA